MLMKAKENSQKHYRVVFTNLYSKIYGTEYKKLSCLVFNIIIDFDLQFLEILWKYNEIKTPIYVRNHICNNNCNYNIYKLK